MKELRKLIDVKSIVTLMLVMSLVYIVVTNKTLNENTFLLYSNMVTMIITYFFTKKKDESGEGK